MGIIFNKHIEQLLPSRWSIRQKILINRIKLQKEYWDKWLSLLKVVLCIATHNNV